MWLLFIRFCSNHQVELVIFWASDSLNFRNAGPTCSPWLIDKSHKVKKKLEQLKNRPNIPMWTLSLIESNQVLFLLNLFQLERTFISYENNHPSSICRCFTPHCCSKRCFYLIFYCGGGKTTQIFHI